MIHPVEEREQELVEPPEGQSRLGMRTRRHHHRCALLAGPLPDRLQQRGLADSRLAPDNEGTPTPPDLIDHSEEALQLLVPPHEQPPGEPCGLRISTTNTHAHPSAFGDDARCGAIARLITAIGANDTRRERALPEKLPT